VGAGFLADSSHVLTCAHVVAQALGLPPSQAAPPDGEVSLDFPLLEPDLQIGATVSFWSPVKDERGDATSKNHGGARIADIAVLEISGQPPAGASASPLIRLNDYWGRKFRAFGFPPGFDEGQWASGLLVDEQATGWVQIEDVKSTGYFVAPGFSGTLVWDVEARGVVGMVVGADARTEVRAAFIIPSQMLVAAWPALERAVVLRPTRRPETMGEVVALINTPEPPPFDQVKPENLSEFFGAWLMHVVKEFFDRVQIVIDKGASAGVSVGDYFALVSTEETIADAQGDFLGSVAQEGSLIRVVQAQERLSLCQLSDWQYGDYFKNMDSALEPFSDAEGNLDLDQLGEHIDVLWPIRKGQPVMRVPPEERTGRQEIEELYGRTLDETINDEERRFLYGEMVRKANAFLLEHATGFFASAVLFQRGYAQFQLGDFRDAIDTFELFLRRYPFSVSADGARDWIDKAKESLKNSASAAQSAKSS
jgi:tetratricopeptide (TPR) repeat protein